MMFRADLAIVMALFSAGAVSATAPKNCDRNAMNKITENFNHPKQFCNWYNQGDRNASPLSALSASSAQHACACILGEVRVSRHIPAASNPGFDKQCTSKAKALLKAEVSHPKQFCDMWTAADWRHVAPFKSMTGPGQLYNACECSYAKASATITPSASSTAASSTMDATADATATAMGFAKRYNQARHAAYRG